MLFSDKCQALHAAGWKLKSKPDSEGRDVHTLSNRADERKFTEYTMIALINAAYEYITNGS